LYDDSAAQEDALIAPASAARSAPRGPTLEYGSSARRCKGRRAGSPPQRTRHRALALLAHWRFEPARHRASASQALPAVEPHRVLDDTAVDARDRRPPSPAFST